MHDTVKETFQHAGRTVEIHYDTSGDLNPRTDYDNCTEMLYWTSRYVIGDRKISRMTEAEVIQEASEKGDKVLAIQPLYAYIHSGITVSTGPFGCAFDSGQVGWVMITESRVESIGLTGYTAEQLKEAIEGDVKTYDDFLNGRVYGYRILGLDREEIDSSWGFVGDLEGCVSEARAAAESSEDPAILVQVEELMNRATYAGHP